MIKVGIVLSPHKVFERPISSALGDELPRQQLEKDDFGVSVINSNLYKVN